MNVTFSTPYAYVFHDFMFNILLLLFRNYQTDTTTIRAAWDVRGDPCPVIKYEWAVERLDGKTIQDFIPVTGKFIPLLNK